MADASMNPPAHARQTVRYVTTADQVRLTWATCGVATEGPDSAAPAMVKAANWITHLDYDWESPVWRHWVGFAELAWGRPDPLYRRLFTKRFLPTGSEEQLRWFDELCARTVRPTMAGRLLRSRGEADVVDLLGQVRVPTLVIHARGDLVSPLSQGQRLAAGIPGAEFVQVDSPNHILLEDEPAWRRFQETVLDFTGVRARVEDAVFDGLAPREREILAKLVSGMTNADIGKALFISEKTVRNQLTRIFGKLGVSNRAQAIVFARDHRFDRE